MAAIELTIKAMDMGDLEGTIHRLSERFHASSTDQAGGGEVPAAEQAPGAGARRPGRPRRVAAAAPAPAAAAVSAAQVPPGTEILGDVGGAAGGDAGAVEPEVGNEGGAEGAAEAQAQDQGAAAGVQAGLGAEEAEPTAQGGEAAEGASSVEEPGSAPAGDGEEPLTIEALKELARKVAATRSFDVMRKIFEDEDVAKPGECPPEKMPAIAGKLRAALPQL